MTGLPPVCYWSSKRVQKTMRRLKRVMTAPPVRLPGEPRVPPDDAPPIVWAVFMGANTYDRLMAEWGISRNDARMRLYEARDKGLVFVNGGRWQVRCIVGRRKGLRSI